MKTIQKREGIVNRRIHDLFYLIDIRANYTQDKCILYQMNEIGNFIWDNLEIADDIRAMTDLLVQQINDEIDWNNVYDDVNSFINLLLFEGFLEKKGEWHGRT